MAAQAKVIIRGENNLTKAVKSASSDLSGLKGAADKLGSTIRGAFTVTAIIAGVKALGNAVKDCVNISDAEKYAALKRHIHDLFPFFDDNALDAARFLFGSASKDVFWNEGWMTIDQELDSIETEIYDQQEQPSVAIPEGRRNNTLSRFAGRVLKRYGDCDRARALFMEEAAKCDPPMEDDELSTIWSSALKFYGKVKKQEGYVNPTDYNSEHGIVSLRPTDFSDMGQAKVFAREYEDDGGDHGVPLWLGLHGDHHFDVVEQMLHDRLGFGDFVFQLVGRGARAGHHIQSKRRHIPENLFIAPDYPTSGYRQ